ncbi:MAG: hypothetical protein M3Z24_08785 [Chloroflexota bacterium]|nr:hypothetical protein [Chloroflexota bacterium]
MKDAPSRYAVPGSVAAYVVTWAYLSGRTAWCWTWLKSLFPVCSFMTPSDQLRVVRGRNLSTSFPLHAGMQCWKLRQPGHRGAAVTALHGHRYPVVLATRPEGALPCLRDLHQTSLAAHAR